MHICFYVSFLDQGSIEARHFLSHTVMVLPPEMGHAGYQILILC